MTENIHLGRGQITECALFAIKDDVAEGSKVRTSGTTTVDTRGGVVDLLSFSPQITITQGINQNFITATISISESMGVLSHFNGVGINGEEFVLLKFKAMYPAEAPYDDEYTLQLYVTGVNNIEFSRLNQSTSFTLVCTTKEALTSAVTFINKGYNDDPNSAMNYHEIAEQIFEEDMRKSDIYTSLFKDYSTSGINLNFAKNKSIDVHPAQDRKAPFVIPGLRVNKAIEFCTRRMFSNNDKPSGVHHTHVFYETLKSFNIHNVEKLINDGIPEADARGAFIRHADPDTDDPNPLRHITEISYSQADTLSQIQKGLFRHKAVGIDPNDPMTEGTYPSEYDYFHYHGGKKNGPLLGGISLGGLPIVSRSFQAHAFKHLTRELYMNIKATNEDYYLVEAQANRMSFVNGLSHYNMTIEIPFNTTILPGHVVKISIPGMSALNKQRSRSENPKVSGYWLVTTVSHFVAGVGGESATSLVLTKDSLGKPSGATLNQPFT